MSVCTVPIVRSTVLERVDAGNPVYVDSFEYFDGLGRSRESQQVAPGGDGKIVVSTRYDQDRNVAVSAPMHMSGAPGVGIADPDPALIPSETRYLHDTQGRVVESHKTSYNVTVPALRVVTDYDGKDTTVAATGAMPVTSRVDGFGRPARTIEHAPGGDWTTIYDIDVLDDLIGITDTAGNVTSYGYDWPCQSDLAPLCRSDLAPPATRRGGVVTV